MTARGYQKNLHHFPDATFLQIVAGFQQLRPAWNELATASAANDIPGMQEVNEAVVQLVKDCGKRLTNTINLKNKPFPQGPGVPLAQVIVPNILLPANAPLEASWVLQQLYRMQVLAPQILPQRMHPGQLNSNLPRLLVHTKSLLPRRIPKGQYNFLCQRLEILLRQQALDRICLPWRCALSNCGCARLLAHSNYQVLHR